jgi:hypothetical protein
MLSEKQEDEKGRLFQEEVKIILRTGPSGS